MSTAGGERWGRVALALVAGTALYNVVEAIVALWFGAQADSIALWGFGLDSVLETMAAAAVLYRLSAEHRGANPSRVALLERRAQWLVGATFLLLAVYVAAQAAWALWTRTSAQVSLVGIALAAISLVAMPLLALFKLRAARELGSEALRSEAKETLACAYLSLTLLLGLTARAALGWWWADPVASLLMVPWLVHEGRESLAGGDGEADA